MDHVSSNPGVLVSAKSRNGWRLAILFVALVVGIFGLLSLLLASYNQAMLAKDADHLFTHVLASGDLDALHRQADVRFQAAYPVEILREFARKSPQLFQRDKIQAQEIKWLTQGGELYVVLRAKVAGADVRYVSAPSEQKSWRLVGIEPGLDAVIPRRLDPIK